MTASGVDLYLVQAFTDNPDGGNSAGVVLDGDRFNDKEKQAIAAKAGYSETAFVNKSDQADFRLDFFTPTRPIPYCGHATVGAVALLQQEGIVNADEVTNESPDGLMKIRLDDGRVFMQQQPPIFDALSDLQIAALYDSLGLTTGAMLDGVMPEIISTGVRFAVIGVDNEDYLRRIRPELRTIANISESHKLIGYYVYATDVDGFDATARMFAPAYGINEESATGMAAGPLGCQLHKRRGVAPDNIRIEQGRFMLTPSLSELTVRLQIDGENIIGVSVGGPAVVKQKLTLTV